MGKSRPCKSPSRSGIGEAKDVKAKLGKYLKTLPFKRHQGGNNLMYTDTLPKPGARQKGCASSKNMLSRQVKRVNPLAVFSDTSQSSERHHAKPFPRSVHKLGEGLGVKEDSTAGEWSEEKVYAPPILKHQYPKAPHRLKNSSPLLRVYQTAGESFRGRAARGLVILRRG
jgi:hypothetical protein